MSTDMLIMHTKCGNIVALCQSECCHTSTTTKTTHSHHGCSLQVFSCSLFRAHVANVAYSCFVCILQLIYNRYDCGCICFNYCMLHAKLFWICIIDCINMDITSYFPFGARIFQIRSLRSVNMPRYIGLKLMLAYWEH